MQIAKRKRLKISTGTYIAQPGQCQSDAAQIGEVKIQNVKT